MKYLKTFESRNYWTEEKLQAEANKYKNRLELKKNNKSAYNAIKSRKLLSKLFKNHVNNGYSENIKPNGYWTDKKLQEESDKYETRDEFIKNSHSAYMTAYKKNLIDKLFKNHLNQGYSDKEEWKENSYVIYAYELEEFNSAYVGLTNNIKRRDKDHIFDEKEKLNMFCKENDISYPKYKILEENLTSTEAQKQENFWKNFYKNNGWEMFNIAKTGSLGGGTIKWTKKALQEEVNKYQTRGEFRKNNAAYIAASKKNIMDELFRNHANNGYSESQKVSGYWAKERLQDEADKYKNMIDFRKNNKLAYDAAQSKGLLGDIFKNHDNQGYSRKRYLKKDIKI